MGIEKDVLRLLKTQGETLTLVHVTTGSYSPVTGVTNTTASTTFKGCITSYVDGDVPNSLTVSNIRKVLIPAKGFGTVPQPQDKITQGSTSYTVLVVNKITLRGVDIAYVCKVQG